MMAAMVFSLLIAACAATTQPQGGAVVLNVEYRRTAWVTPAALMQLEGGLCGIRALPWVFTLQPNLLRWMVYLFPDSSRYYLLLCTGTDAMLRPWDSALPSWFGYDLRLAQQTRLDDERCSF